MKASLKFGIALFSLPVLVSAAAAQTWHVLTNSPNFSFGAGTALLLTDGSVIVHNENARSSANGGGIGGDWKRLKPDSSGSYVNGTWSSAGSMPAGYGPLYFASAVLADGRVVTIGGEYNLNQGGVETNKGAIYDPLTNTWASLSPPAGWGNIGDSPCCLLPDGRFMVGQYNTSACAILNPSTLTWTSTGSGKADWNAEEGWALLPDNTILTVDCSNGQHAEKYDIATGTWISAGDTVDPLPFSWEGAAFVPEIGPSVLRPNGTVWTAGATNHTGIYIPPANHLATGTWTAGPDMPTIAAGSLDCPDAPACLTPNGDVLVAMSVHGASNPPTMYYLFDGTNMVDVGDPSDFNTYVCWMARMLLLPNGDILVTNGTNNVEIFRPARWPVQPYKPVITSMPQAVRPNSTITLSGLRFNGISQAVAYGDDAAAATNYPIVRITNDTTGDVQYCRTHDHSTMGVSTGSTIVSTQVDLPSTLELGTSKLEVVANGVTSGYYAIKVSPKIVSGTVVLQGLTAGAYVGTNVTVEIRTAGTLTNVDTQTVTLDAAGHFTLGTALVANTYDIAIKGSHWLKQKLANVSIGPTGATGLSWSLKNGDVNGDNAVTLGDFAQLKAAFGSSTGDPTWNANADLNGDGSVTLGDFALLKANFGLSGDP